MIFWGVGYEKWEPLLLILDTMGSLQEWHDDHFSGGDIGDIEPELAWMIRRRHLLHMVDRLIVQLRMWKIDTTRAYVFARWIQQYRTDDEKTRALAASFSELLSEALHEAEAQWRLAGNPTTPPWAKKKGGGEGEPKVQESVAVPTTPKTLDRASMAILYFLDGEQVSRTQVEIGAGVDMEGGIRGGIERKAVGKRLKDLMKQGFVVQPMGSRKGYVITDAGKRCQEPFAAKFRPSNDRNNQKGH